MDMWGEIGTAAGKVYSAFVGAAPTAVAEVKRKTKLSDDMLYMSLGWLAREGKAQMTVEKSVLKVKVSE